MNRPRRPGSEPDNFKPPEINVDLNDPAQLAEVQRDEELDEQAVRLYVAGHTYRQVAAIQGISKSGA